MSTQYSKHLHQVATYWEQTGTDITGAGSFSSPVLKNCRWEDSAELFIDKEGQEVASRSKVFFDSDISLEGYLYLGDATGQANPSSVSGAYEIRQVKRTPDLRNMQTLRVAFL